MDIIRFLKIEEIFHSARNLVGRERDEYLAEACANDEALRLEIESLLSSADEADDFMNESPFSLGIRVISNREESSITGLHIGNYHVQQLLGRGGMGEVYLAYDERLERQVALKVLPSILTDDAECVRRFEREARAASKISHPNVAHIYGIGEGEGRHFIVMELIEGENLRARLSAGRMSVEDALETSLQVAAALHAAHKNGVIHRDIKPENIMLRSDDEFSAIRVKVLDFGLAKLNRPSAIGGTVGLTGRTLLTQPGMVMGTTHYMSPEQARGREVDARTDIWSLGCVLYEMVTGCRPFEAQTSSDEIAAILSQRPTPLARFMEAPPAGLEEIILKSLCKDREGRQQTASELIRELENLKQALHSPQGQETQADLEEIEEIINALGRGDCEVSEAAESLSRFGTRAAAPLIEALDSEEKWERMLAPLVLAKLKLAEGIEPLIETFADEDEERHGNVHSALMSYGRIAIKSLIKALRNNAPQVRYYAAMCLRGFVDEETSMFITDERAVEPLLTTLRTDASPAVREQAAYALVNYDDERVVLSLIEALETDKADNVRWAAARMLGETGDERAAAPLIKALRRDYYEYVRNAAADSLADLNATSAVEVLIDALSDRSEMVRRTAAQSLGMLGDERAIEALQECYYDVSEQVRQSAAEALQQLEGSGGTTAARLISALEGRSDFFDRRPIVAELVGLGDEGIDPLIDALGHHDQWVRTGAATALGDMKDRRAVYPLIEALEDESWHVRQALVIALGAIGDAAAVEPLIEALADEHEAVRHNAANALGYIKDVRAIEPLIAALKSPDDMLKSGAHNALLSFGRAALKPLVAMLENDDPSCRFEAAVILAYMNDRRAFEPLLAAFKKGPVNTRVYAARLLEDLKDRRACEPLAAALKDKNAKVRLAAAEALSKFGDRRGVEVLIQALSARDVLSRMSGAIELGRLKDSRAVPPLIEALKDKDFNVRREAALALAELKDKRAVGPLTEMASVEDIDENRRVAIDALEWIRS